MGREQRRREAKRNKKALENVNLEEEFKMSTTIKVVAGVILVLLALYYVIAIFVTKEINISAKNDSDTEEVSNSEESSGDEESSTKILASATFRQSPEVYYVYYYDFSDELEEVTTEVDGITGDKVFKVDTSDSLNSNYVTDDKGNKDVTDIGDLKVKNPTLIKIDNDKVVGYYEGKDDILEFLNK